MIWLLLIALLVIGVAAWRMLAADERAEMGAAVAQRAGVWLALAGVLALAAVWLLPLPAWLPRTTLALLLALAWGGAVALVWQQMVLPPPALAFALAPPWQRPPLVLPPAPPAVPEALVWDEDGPPPPLTPAADPDDPDAVPPLPVATHVRREFRWRFTPRSGVPVEQRLTLLVDRARYAEARAEARRPVGDWAHYALKDMPELDALTIAFHNLHAGKGWSTFDQAANVLCFTQACIAYRYDEETTPAAEWPRYPIETLYDCVGDCEDDVILAAAILKRLGIDVALLYYPGHCALGVAGAPHVAGEFVLDRRTGVAYFYGETTAEGHHIGELPAGMRGEPLWGMEVVQRVVA